VGPRGPRASHAAPRDWHARRPNARAVLLPGRDVTSQSLFPTNLGVPGAGPVAQKKEKKNDRLRVQKFFRPLEGASALDNSPPSSSSRTGLTRPRRGSPLRAGPGPLPSPGANERRGPALSPRRAVGPGPPCAGAFGRVHRPRAPALHLSGVERPSGSAISLALVVRAALLPGRLTDATRLCVRTGSSTSCSSSTPAGAPPRRHQPTTGKWPTASPPRLPAADGAASIRSATGPGLALTRSREALPAGQGGDPACSAHGPRGHNGQVGDDSKPRPRGGGPY